MSKMSLIAQVRAYTTRSNNAGIAGLAMLEKTIDHMFKHGDSTPLAWLIAKIDRRDASILRAIVGQVTGGLSLVSTSKEAKEQPSGLLIKLGDNAGPTEKMAILRKLVEDGESFRGKAVSEELLSRTPPKYDLHRATATFLKRAVKNASVGDIMKEMQAIVATMAVDGDKDMQVIEPKPAKK